MDDDGELRSVGQFHLRAEDRGLDVAGGMVVKVVEANFTPGDDLGVLGEAEVSDAAEVLE